MTEEEKIEKKEDKISKKDHKNKDKKKIEELEIEGAELKDKNMRVTAEMINTIRRKEEETARLLKYSNESLILEITLKACVEETVKIILSFDNPLLLLNPSCIRYSKIIFLDSSSPAAIG